MLNLKFVVNLSAMGDRNANRRNLTYREKVAIIRKKDEQPSWTQRNLARWAMEHFGMEKRPTQATISNTLRNREKHLRPDVPPEFCSVRPVKHPEMDMLMIQWVRQELQEEVSITRAAVQKKAQEFAQELNLQGNVKFSKGPDDAAVVVEPPQIAMPTAPIPLVAVAAAAAPAPVTALASISEVEDGNTQIDNGVEVEEEGGEEEVEEHVEEKGVMEEPETRVTESSSKHTGKRRRESFDGTNSAINTSDSNSSSSTSDDRAGDGFSAEDRATVDLLLDWIMEPGNYSRWWLQKDDADKPQPLLDEINLFLRSHGLRGMASSQIKVRIAAFTTSFQAAHTWMRQTGNDYPVDSVNRTAEQERIKSHVLQMCPHYEKLAPVLSPYANYDANTADSQRAATPAIETPEKVNGDGAPSLSTQGDDTEGGIALKPPKQVRRQSTETTQGDDGDPEEKAQRRRLFELECARLQSEIETKNIQLLVEKSLARKKLLDAGISPEEVDRILPL
ncbi:hypothetical protein BBO99_00002988 [Phytophthora kernoviae]|uniref:HTH CENPB-type domain-containing protein n=2 Tax=Phytophthora kernoviae TaxID=325452 RepID=A0A3R7FXR8_9STRA|nr:hypothetical protein G195_003288 [Phytophthora kernoviae 00238/432]KAG2526542.1 hypothetical protein JM16_002724 [Phytophthora kernoviae]KAG2528127.1 hypothetical protein JM18_003384 [Phytophthora kernoviae]RLN02524.1 hypothetical protein BBI17_003094 [Phytophthora kernoviae]RLN82355.1 hypothetical protein BBO99_00002988 [Phytophthora kernoviae]